MLLNLQQLFDIVDERIDIDYDIDLSDVKLAGECPFGSSVHIAGLIENRAGIVTLAYTAKFLLSYPCDRCTEVFNRDESYEFTHILIQELNEEDDSDDYIVAENSQLDLDELVTSDVLLSLPTKMLCKDDCKGLCPKCGTNLNDCDCTCSRKECDSRLEALRELLD